MPRLLIELFNAARRPIESRWRRPRARIDAFEATLFGDARSSAATLHEIHILKRRVTLIKRLLWQTQDVVQRWCPARSRRRRCSRTSGRTRRAMHFYADELLEDVNNLLSIQLALASHRTNEVMRVLTVFSVFFLPLTFIVGVYGMNFEYMPELAQRWGIRRSWRPWCW